MAFISNVNNNVNVTAPALNKNSESAGGGFDELLKKEIDSTNEMLNKAEETEAAMATGQVKDLAQAAITIQKAEMKMKMMLEVRNKAINAYKELLKTQM